MNRRIFLLGGLTTIASMTTIAAVKPSTNRNETLFFSACRDDKGQDYVAGFSRLGRYNFLIAVPQRAHDSLFIAEQGQVIFWGRSPSRRSYIVDLKTKTILNTLSPPAGHYFCGHGCLAPDSYLYVAESTFDNHQGMVGIYDTRSNYQRIGEYKTHGVEPHQLVCLPGKSVLVVANGGVIKDHKHSKQIINKDNFESFLSYIDLTTGALLGKYYSQYQRLSLRHLTLGDNQTVYIGAQSHGDEVVPLVFSHQGEGEVLPFKAEDYIWQSHNHYTASLAFQDDILVVTSPRGHIVSFWDIRRKEYIKQKSLMDVAGVARVISESGVAENYFLLSSGIGSTVELGLGNKLAIKNRNHYDLAWDNHLSTNHLSTR